MTKLIGKALHTYTPFTIAYGRMNTLFVTDRMHVPDDHSGSVQTTHSIAQGLIDRGHQVSALASLPAGVRHNFVTALYRLTGGGILVDFPDQLAGYPVRRGSEWRLAPRLVKQLARTRPDVVVLDALRQMDVFTRARIKLPCPVVVFIHDVHFRARANTIATAFDTHFVANSPFTAVQFEKHFGIKPYIVPPIIDLNRYRATRIEAGYVTMVSPTKRKGIETTLQLAALCPDIPFLLVEGWPMPKVQWNELREQSAKLGNVVLRRSTADMRSIYAVTKVLIVPSDVDETFGRVVVEAQANSIPVIASNRGALEWVVGRGGTVISDPAQIEEWRTSLRRIWDCGDVYQQKSAEAIKNSGRPDFSASDLLDRIEGILKCAARD